MKCTSKTKETHCSKKKGKSNRSCRSSTGNKELHLLNLKQKGESRSLLIRKINSKAKQIEEERKNKIIQKETQRDQLLQKKLIERKESLSVQKEYYRQAVKLNSSEIEDHRRNKFLKKLESKEERFRTSNSRKEQELKLK